MKLESNIKMSSNRSFGIVFFIFFTILGLWPLKSGGEINLLLIVISIIFLFLGLIQSKLLSPLNKLWFKFGIKLGAIISPLVMGIVFFLVVTPIGIVMNIFGKDLLNKKMNKKEKSYWVIRKRSTGTMKRQF